MINSKTNKPLSNAQALIKATRVLKEILPRLYSDPLGVKMYTRQFKMDGLMQNNKYGMTTIECMRCTNQPESYHKNCVTTFGTWVTGIEMLDCLLAKRRHWHNHKTSERRRADFPMVALNTWLIDSLQLILWSNHGIQLFSCWSNPSDNRETAESFDTVALHSSTLHEALVEQFENGIDRSTVKLSQDQQYVCNAMKICRSYLLHQEKNI
jgi:hypothetical protein